MKTKYYKNIEKCMGSNITLKANVKRHYGDMNPPNKEFAGFLTSETDVGICVEFGEIDAYGKREARFFFFDDITDIKITKPAKKLTMEEWELYCVNVLGIHLGSISVTGKGFAIKGYLLDGEMIISFDEEIDMLKVHKEAQE